MIITSTSVTPGGSLLIGDRAVQWRCLARRGMLHSECEAVDHVVLPPSEVLDRRGRDGVAECWFVVDGAATTEAGDPLIAGDTVLVSPDDSAASIRARTTTRVLTVSVLADNATQQLDSRRPDLHHAKSRE